MIKLVSYKTVWYGRDRDGNAEYHYLCKWSDGTETEQMSLPWGSPAMDGAANLDRLVA